MVKSFDVIVVGAGHSGIEAGLASARRGAHTLMLTINLDNIAFMPCNPSVGDLRKGLSCEKSMRSVDKWRKQSIKHIFKCVC